MPNINNLDDFDIFSQAGKKATPPSAFIKKNAPKTSQPTIDTFQDKEKKALGPIQAPLPAQNVQKQEDAPLVQDKVIQTAPVLPQKGFKTSPSYTAEEFKNELQDNDDAYQKVTFLINEADYWGLKVIERKITKKKEASGKRISGSMIVRSLIHTFVEAEKMGKINLSSVTEEADVVELLKACWRN